MPRRYELSNKIKIVTERTPYLRSATIGVWIRAGSVNETPQTNGVSHLLEHLFFKGTKTRSARQIMEALEKAMAAKDHPVLLDFRTAPEENVYPMVPAGKAIDQMLSGMA